MPLLSNKNQEEVNQKRVRSLLRSKDNKKCFDCSTKGPAFVNTTIQTFICSRCSGLVREVGHRVKAISASRFSGPEVLALEHGGNEVARQIWLSNYSTNETPEAETDTDVRAFMRQKYYENKWLDPALLQAHKEKVRELIYKNFDENGVPLVINKSRKETVVDAFSQVPLIANEEMNIMQKEDGVAHYDHHRLPSSPTSPISPTGPYVVESSENSFSGTINHSYYSQHVLPHTEPKNSPMYDFDQKRVGSMLHRRNSSRQSNHSNQDSFTTASESIRNSTDSNRSDLSQLEQQHPTVLSSSIPPTIFPNSSKSVPMLNLYSNNYHINVPYALPSAAEKRLEINTQRPILKESGSPAELKALTSPTSRTATPPATANERRAANTITEPTKKPNSTFDSIISDLAGLQLQKTVRRATYTGGLLTPTAVTPSVSANLLDSRNGRPVSMTDCDFFATLNKRVSSELPANDQYAALRGIQIQKAPNKLEGVESNSQDIVHSVADNNDDDDDEEQWDEFCSSTTTASNEGFENALPPPNKPPFGQEKAVGELSTKSTLFIDLDPRAVLKRF